MEMMGSNPNRIISNKTIGVVNQKLLHSGQQALKVSIISNSVLIRVKKKTLTFRNVCCDLFLEKMTAME